MYQPSKPNLGHKFIFFISVLPIVLFVVTLFKSNFFGLIDVCLRLFPILIYSILIYFFAKQLATVQVSRNDLLISRLFKKQEKIEYSSIVKVTQQFNHFTLLKPIRMHPYTLHYRENDVLKKVMFFCGDLPIELENLINQSNKIF